ncbi:N-acetylmuramoyl-L-alanine amidase [Alkalithermobacter thermoalcaliphilus JW-YL-7 = DSM 7308]|uniref:N-acetylmuramoyl-L-alanine amidase n=1 Tax=Alkalithermobacter thermoalcaliphilus JW-YL-7 = DSM 7308 TaxID=1121328 RepID=A0A150FN85_CLOPD|nr:N-acetylmuramoyl-L-alanine amidase CwlD [[Clostridium] paradoxum JW-YL-7 = DSM 7308]SHL24417.1 N-acetylmuramoyl-L-alanine amidase [[Clostridium] paradoxum JW-YL-7 = DSM 7308]
MIIFINKKFIYGIFAFILLLCLSIYLVNDNTSKVSTNMPVTNKVIILDAGHGDLDTGAVGENNTFEKDINLQIVLKLRTLLEESGALVILTREKDQRLYDKAQTIREKYLEDLRNRKQLIKDSKADLLISIHLNSFPQKKYYGAQVFYPKSDKKSKEIAQFIQEELRRVLDKENKRNIKPRDNIYLLENNNIPSVLIECGFLSNEREAELLKTDSYQDKIAWAIYIGIQKYFSSIE